MGTISVAPALVERFTQKVLVADSDECWLWQAATDDDGYGVFWIPSSLDFWEPAKKAGKRGRTVRAHMFSYMLAYGHWPEPEACHHCDNPPCCNPRHLYEGTRSDNMQDKAERRRRHLG